MDIEGYLYSGVTRVGTFSNPIYVTFSATPPSGSSGVKEETVPKPPEKEIQIIYRDVPYYNIKGDGLAFRLWVWIGERAGWIHGR